MKNKIIYLIQMVLTATIYLFLLAFYVIFEKLLEAVENFILWLGDQADEKKK
jgi:hypothetical protein